MSEPALGVVVAHAELARAFVHAVERISGTPGALVPVTNEGAGPEELCRRVTEACGEGPAIIFVDLASGSCAFAGRVAARGAARRAVVTGASLPMLLDFVFHREMPLPDLVDRVVAKGRAEAAGHVLEPTPPR